MRNAQKTPSSAASGPHAAPDSPQDAQAHGGVRKMTRMINPLILKLAGTRLLPLYAVLEHRGRRSGKLYHTPVVVRQSGEAFIVPMPWSEGTDWYRNVKAAGECVVRWKGQDYLMAEPEVMSAAAAQGSFSAFQRALIARFKITHYLHLSRRR